MKDESNRLPSAFSALVLQPSSFLPLTRQVASPMIPRREAGSDPVAVHFFTEEERQCARARIVRHPTRISRNVSR